MVADVPSTISKGDISDLNLGWYKGLVFDIPGAEVLVDGQWVVYDANDTASTSLSPSAFRSNIFLRRSPVSSE
jgi:hypothetical protein